MGNYLFAIFHLIVFLAFRITIDLLMTWYIAAILLVPDLMVGRLLQGMTSILAGSLEALGKRQMSTKEFCERVDTVRVAYGKMGKIFKYNILLLVSISLIRMIMEAFFVISRLLESEQYGQELLMSVKNALYIVIAAKRLLHLTGLVHGLRNVVDNVEEKLIDKEVRLHLASTCMYTVLVQYTYSYFLTAILRRSIEIPQAAGKVQWVLGSGLLLAGSHHIPLARRILSHLLLAPSRV